MVLIRDLRDALRKRREAEEALQAKEVGTFYCVTQKLPQICTANYATFSIRIHKITVQICGNFWGTFYNIKMIEPATYTGSLLLLVCSSICLFVSLFFFYWSVCLFVSLFFLLLVCLSVLPFVCLSVVNYFAPHQTVCPCSLLCPGNFSKLTYATRFQNHVHYEKVKYVGL